MLNRVLNEIKRADGPVLLSNLSRKLDIEPDALQGMVDFLIRKGQLQDDDGETAVTQSCSSPTCGSSCTGTSQCTFIAKMPKSYSIPLRNIP